MCVHLFLATDSFLGPHASVRTEVHQPFIIQACRTWTSIFLSHNILVPWLCVVSLRAINRITVSGIVLFNGPIKVSIVLLPLQFYNEVHWKGCWPQLENWFTKKRTWTCFKWQEICLQGNLKYVFYIWMFDCFYWFHVDNGTKSFETLLCECNWVQSSRSRHSNQFESHQKKIV